MPIQDEAETKLLDLVKGRDWVSFVEATRELESLGSKGNLEMLFPDRDDLVIWPGVSQLFVDTVNSLLAKKLIHYAAGSEFSYFVDGGVPRYPVARTMRKSKKTRWVPLFLRLGPAPK